ncbi:enoyl-CoA hydratase (plasmid) [Pseudonocardia sp. EC080610-09]|uniref:crotonase/enoyl-CoA hydratase family protein n=1 Tax=unclassified Pseudonocardia TaxID=2619320 RepID=UPI0007068918|nr:MULTISPECIES: crotonase/enoyl-CoA hydratase family protein [unclassified Pseudonocardia]ALL79713.1 enoyl-CoA hydratase [Pseudonocardia sp. EC080610-09]ALL85683.1 enoyl-CoA hydratase [Pseudonocardia sp. EC080619-01]
MNPQSRALKVSVDEHVARVELLGPGPGNAMGPELFAELPRVFGELDDDPQVRAIVLHGSGGSFSYGLDLQTMRGSFEPLLQSPTVTARTSFLREVRELQSAVTAVADCRTPVVAAIAGWCVGGGVDLAAATDVRLASADAIFSVREARVAIVADLGSLQRLVGIIGDGHLRELALTGADVDAERAATIGLVNDVLPDEAGLLDAADALARAIAANPPLTVRGIKDVLDAERAPRVEAGLRYVAAWNAAFAPSEDLAEAFTAFAERRPARFQGR